MSTVLLLVALLILGLVSDWRHRRQLAPLLRALAEIRQDLIDGTVAIVQDVSGSEARLSAALAVHFPSPLPPAVVGPPAERQAVTLVLMDAHENQELHRLSVEPRRRPRTVPYEGVPYSCVRGPLATGEYIYRRDV